MKEFKTNIETDTTDNSDYRHVIFTANHLQLVLMSLQPGEEIGMESNVGTNQFFRFEAGNGKCIIDGNEYKVKNGDALNAPAGTNRNVINTDSENELKMYTIYSPPIALTNL